MTFDEFMLATSASYGPKAAGPRPGLESSGFEGALERRVAAGDASLRSSGYFSGAGARLLE